MNKSLISDPIYPISSQERLLAINKSQYLPDQDPREILFNFSFDHHRELNPFLLPEYKGPYPLNTLAPVFREQHLLEYIESFPLSLNVVYTFINQSRSTLWIKSYEPNRIGIGVFVGRHIFFHTGIPFTSLDTIKDTGKPFQPIPNCQRSGTGIGIGYYHQYHNPEIEFD